MLNAHQLMELRKLSTSSDFPTEKDGLPLQKVELETADTIAEPIVNISETATLYPPTQVFGTPASPSCLVGISARQLQLAPAQVRRIRNARIVGTCAVLAPNKMLYSADPVTSEGLELTLLKNKWNHQGYLLHRNDDGSTHIVFVGREQPRVITPKNVLYFHNIEPGNYGSFLIRQLPQMMLMKSFCSGCDAYITPSITPWFMEALDILRFPSKPVFSSAWISGEMFESITFANDFENEGFLLKQTREDLLDAFGLRKSKQHRRKLYISRALSTMYRPNYRPLVNEQEIEAIVTDQSFEIVYPESLRLIEQARLFAQASHIVGPSGSGMLNSIFSQKARVLDMESMSVAVRQHAKVYASSDHEYGFLFGNLASDDRALHLRNWTVPIPLFMNALSWLQSS